ncbi:phage major tail protein, TP901-1 family [Sediminibacillus massiliensis]|uniref:phage major tail protein, TP901-1 family n=1 Tax=Sediminibacillus massiliensis TaxID=1926277 RepID=UPI0009886CC2|nr:phage major tail protein, TP901-1 family [Sediminibacillus massiliensis]
MAEIAKGVHKVLYFRKLGEAAEAARLVFQTEHSKSASRERETTQTKDGGVSGGAPLEEEVSISALQSTDDPTFTMLEDSIYGDETDDQGYAVEMWEVNLAKKTVETDTDGTTEITKFAAEYRQGYITSWETTSGSEDDPTVEGTFITEGKRKKGKVTLPDGDIETLSYVFHDILAEDPADDGLASGAPTA